LTACLPRAGVGAFGIPATLALASV